MDWIHQAIAVASTGKNVATVTLSLQGPPEIQRRVRLRVAGFMHRKFRHRVTSAGAGRTAPVGAISRE
jgi:hypothetical protein